MRMELLRGEGDARVLRVSALLPDGSPSVVEVFGPRGWRDHTVGVRGPGGRRRAETAGGAAARADRRGRAARERGPARNPLRGDVAGELHGAPGAPDRRVSGACPAPGGKPCAAQRSTRPLRCGRHSPLEFRSDGPEVPVRSRLVPDRVEQAPLAAAGLCRCRRGGPPRSGPGGF